MEGKTKKVTVHRIWVEGDWDSDFFFMLDHETGAWFSLKRIFDMTFHQTPVLEEVALAHIGQANKAQKELGVEDSFVVTRQILTEDVQVPAIKLLDAPAELHSGG